MRTVRRPHGLAPALCIAACFVVGCAQPYAVGRLDPARVPSMNDQGGPRRDPVVDSSGTGSPRADTRAGASGQGDVAKARPADAAGALRTAATPWNGAEPNRGDGEPGGPKPNALRPAAFQPVAHARVTEDDVIEHLRLLQAQHGAAALERLPKGTTLPERLRYCTSRIALARTEEVLSELQRLRLDHPDDPMVWRQLCRAQFELDMFDDAVASGRRAFELGHRDGYETCPTLPSFYGALLLRRGKTRDEGFRILRRELAEGDDFVHAARNLVEHFRQHEQHRSALVCLDAAIARDPKNEQLKIKKAEICLELYDVKQAVAILDPMLAVEKPPRLAIERRVQACLLAADFKGALALLDRLLARTAGSTAAHKLLQTRRDEVSKAVKEGTREHLPAWELGAILRGHPDLPFRRTVLRMVVAKEDQSFAEFALQTAFNCDSAVLRAEALRLMMPRSTRQIATLISGLRDEDGVVRGTAALLAMGLTSNRDRAVALLGEFMAVESDDYAFRQMHDALSKLTGRTVALPVGAFKDPKQRAAIVAQWRKDS